MESEQRWSHSKASLIMALALFPGKFEGQVVTLRDYRQYFESQNDRQFWSELNQYQKDGYFQFQRIPLFTSSGTPELGFLVKNVDINKATTDLKQYADRRQRERMAARAVPSTRSTRRRVDIVMEEISPGNHAIFAVLETGERYKLKESLKTDMAPKCLMQYLLSHRNKLVTLTYAKTGIEGCEHVRNLSEVVRQSGFPQKLKLLFFATCTSGSVQMKDDVYLTDDEISLLMV